MSQRPVVENHLYPQYQKELGAQYNHPILNGWKQCVLKEMCKTLVREDRIFENRKIRFKQRWPL